LPLLEVAPAILFWGLTAEGWTAVGTLVLAVATAVLVGVGVFQITSIRREASRARTLEACEKYDTDPVLDFYLRRLSTCRRDQSFFKDPDAFRTDVATVLNYLDSIACGIEQGLYIETLARDHIENVVKGHFNQYLGQEAPKIDGIDPANYHRLKALYEEWSAPQPVRFRDRRFRLKRRRD